MFALFQLTLLDHAGAVDSEVTEDQLGSPERLRGCHVSPVFADALRWPAATYLIDVTSQFLATAALQILLPKKPFPPQTTIFLLADADAAAVDAIAAVVILRCVGLRCCVDSEAIRAGYVGSKGVVIGRDGGCVFCSSDVLV
jgi:hypothetical protein